MSENCDRRARQKSRKEEEAHIISALKNCGYPAWTFNTVKKQMNKSTAKTKTDKSNDEHCKGLVILLYVQVVSGCIHWNLLKYKIASTFKPMNTIRQLMVHPKDKRELGENSKVVYKIPCQSC